MVTLLGRMTEPDSLLLGITTADTGDERLFSSGAGLLSNDHRAAICSF